MSQPNGASTGGGGDIASAPVIPTRSIANNGDTGPLSNVAEVLGSISEVRPKRSADEEANETRITSHTAVVIKTPIDRNNNNSTSDKNSVQAVQLEQEADKVTSNSGSKLEGTPVMLRRRAPGGPEDAPAADLASRIVTQLLPPEQEQMAPKKRQRLELQDWNEMPRYLQFNPYVLTGYRPLQTISGCLSSLFYFHNETFNILTHGE